MADTFSTTSTRGFGSRIMGSITGVFMGFLLFILSFGVLFWNEGRTDLSSIAKKSVEVSSVQVATDKDGAFVSTTGVVSADVPLGDGQMLKPGNYISIQRNVEMYAWIEKSDSKTTSNVGGSETTTTNYTYTKDWTSDPQRSSTFKVPDGHTNPSMTVKPASVTATSLKVGAYNVDGDIVDLPSPDALPLSADLLTLPADAQISGDAVYLHHADPAAPVIGDQRVSYSVLKSGFTGTIFGKISLGNIIKYADGKGNTLYRIFKGDRASALATLHGEYMTWLWVFRAIGFLMMWFGLMMILGPIEVLLDFFPILGSIGKMAISIITLAIAIPLAGITIVVSAIAHSVLALLIVLAVAVGGVGYFVIKNKDKIRAKMPSL